MLLATQDWPAKLKRENCWPKHGHPPKPEECNFLLFHP